MLFPRFLACSRPLTMSATSSAQLLKLALPLIRTHGFTREALSRSVLALPPDRAHSEPLSDTAVTALFGKGEAARRVLIEAWLNDGIRHMTTVGIVAQSSTNSDTTVPKVALRDVLRARLEYNEPVLQYLPEAFALLASPRSGIPPLDPTRAMKHAACVADEACVITGDTSLQLDWYAKRASLAAIYAASELHQLTSPRTTYAFLDSLLDTSSVVKTSLEGVGQDLSFIFHGWKGIIKSSGIFP